MLRSLLLSCWISKNLFWLENSRFSSRKMNKFDVVWCSKMADESKNWVDPCILVLPSWCAWTHRGSEERLPNSGRSKQDHPSRSVSVGHFNTSDWSGLTYLNKYWMDHHKNVYWHLWSLEDKSCWFGDFSSSAYIYRERDVNSCGFGWNVSINIGWITMKFSTDINASLRMKCNIFWRSLNV